MKIKFDKIILALVLVLTVAAFAIPSASVSADPGDGDPSRSTEGLIARLEKMFARQQQIQPRQEARLGKAEEIVARSQDYIEKEQAAGYDTSALEAALSDFEAVFEENAVLSAAAGELIAAHAGFDADGKVTDAKTARQTVTQIGKNQRQFHLAATRATMELRAALREYRELNHPRPQQQP